MADPNVKNVAAAQVNKSLAANYSYIKKSSEKTINNSFGNLMQNSLNKMTDSSNKQNMALPIRAYQAGNTWISSKAMLPEERLRLNR